MGVHSLTFDVYEDSIIAENSGNSQAWTSDALATVGRTVYGQTRMITRFVPAWYIPSGAYIFDASAWFRNINSTSGNVDVYRINNATAITSMTWNNTSFPENITGGFVLPAQNAWWSQDVASPLRAYQDSVLALGLIGDGTNGQYVQISTREGSYTPYISCNYGYYIPSWGATMGPRTINSVWGGCPGGVNVQYRSRLYRTSDNALIADSGYLSEGTYSYLFSGLSSTTSYYNRIVSNYNYSGANHETPYRQSSNLIPSQANASNGPTIAGDSPYRRQITITAPTASGSSSSWDYEIFRPATAATVKSGNSSNSSVTVDCSDQPDEGYQVRVRLHWSDGDVGTWSSYSSTTISTPSIASTSSASTTEFRQITVTWNRLSDASSYSVVRTAGTGIGGGNQTISVSNPGSGATVSLTFTSVVTGAHSISITPVYTNGYQTCAYPTVIGDTATGASIKPTPTTPTGLTGDSPNKRQINVPMPSLPSAFYSADSWEVMRDGNTATLVTVTTSSATLSQVYRGTHTVQVRARWTTGSDFSNWSTPSAGVVTTSPPVTSPLARQRSGAYVAPISIASGSGGTIAAGTYFVATSVNKGGSAQTDGTAPDTARYVNESTPSVVSSHVLTGTTSSISVPQPPSMTSGDTWNVYIGTVRNRLKRHTQNRAMGAGNYTIASYTAPSVNETKLGKVDLSWTNPTGVGDNPTSWKVERIPNDPENDPTGALGTTVIVATNRIGFAGVYASGTKFWEDLLDTKFYNYRVYAVYNNLEGTVDTSDSVDVSV